MVVVSVFVSLKGHVEQWVIPALAKAVIGKGARGRSWGTGTVVGHGARSWEQGTVMGTVVGHGAQLWDMGHARGACGTVVGHGAQSGAWGTVGATVGLRQQPCRNQPMNLFLLSWNLASSATV